MQKRGQAAMEFLMTYGWAIMVILVALASLYYLGLFDAEIPTTAQFGSGPFVAQDIRISDTGVRVRVMAVGISAASVSQMTVNGESCGIADEDISSATRGSYDITCPLSLTPGERVSGEIKLLYTSIGGLEHSVTGTFSGDVSETVTSTTPLLLNDVTVASYSGILGSVDVTILGTGGATFGFFDTIYSDGSEPSPAQQVYISISGAIANSDGTYIQITSVTGKIIKVYLPEITDSPTVLYVADDGSTYSSAASGGVFASADLEKAAP